MESKQIESVAETKRIAERCFPKGNGYMQLRAKYGALFADSDFADLYSWKGADGTSPGLLATVTILQYVEGLTDREAAEQVRSRIDWKYLLDKEITYAGFHYSILSEFRRRLVAAGAEERLFEIPLARMKELGLVRGGGRQRTDSTHILAQIRVLNRLELVGETLRQALNEVAILAPAWLKGWAPAAWYARYGTRIEEGRLPQEQSERELMVQIIGQDGYTLLSKLNEAEAPAYLLDSLAVQVLRMVWLQHYYGPEQGGAWRQKADLPPAHLMINSPYDTEAQFSRKRHITWTGYKAHLSESCDDERPHLITHVETTPATETDCVTLPTINGALIAKGLPPKEHLIDAGYMDILNLITSRDTHHIDLVGPVRPDTSWQTREQTGYGIAHFVIDWENQLVTCPQGKTSTVWSHTTDKNGDASIAVRFHKHECLACPARTLCTHAKTEARGLHLQPTQTLHTTLQAARLHQLSDDFKQQYQPRAGIEGTLSQAVRAFALRRTRFIGQAKTRLQNLATATAINLSRLNHWWLAHEPALTRTSTFLELKSMPVA